MSAPPEAPISSGMTSESLLTFPCVFPIKVMGRREDGFAQRSPRSCCATRPTSIPRRIEMRTSKNGRYLSLTVNLNARVARAARRALHGAVEAPDGDDGPVIARAPRWGSSAYEPTLAGDAGVHARRARARPPTSSGWSSIPPVFTLGLAGRPEHVLAPGDIPVVTTDRGGQVTYHGPGQAVRYVLLDLRRAGLRGEELVRRLEQSVIDVLAGYGVRASGARAMPGVYVGGAKIAAIGLRVARGCSYHGVALNVDMDLEPFARIDPCGYPGLAVARAWPTWGSA